MSIYNGHSENDFFDKFYDLASKEITTTDGMVKYYKALEKVADTNLAFEDIKRMYQNAVRDYRLAVASHHILLNIISQNIKLSSWPTKEQMDKITDMYNHIGSILIAQNELKGL